MTPPLSAGRRPALPAALPVALAFLAWRFAWDNARTSSGLPVGVLMPVPRAFRLVEMGVVLLLLAAVLLRPAGLVRQRTAGVVVALCVVLLGAASAVAGAASGLVHLGAAFQMVYAYTVPLLVCAAVAGLASHAGDAERVLRWFLAGVCVSAVVGWYQFGVLDRVGDDVHGLLRDAHHFASALWLAVLWLVARLWVGYGSRLWSVVGLALIVPVALAAANEKATAMVAITLGLGCAWWLWRRGWVMRGALVAAVAIVAGYVQGLVGGRIEVPPVIVRYQLVAENFANSGLFEAYHKLGTVMREHPRAWVLGTGPGSYGSTKALDEVALGGEIPPLAAQYTAPSYRLGFLSSAKVGSYVEESTDLTALLVEFGPLALVLLIAAAWLLLVTPARVALRREDPAVRAMGAWLLLGTMFVALLAAVTAFYGWSSVEATTWPLALAAALLPSALNSAPHSAAA